MNGNSGKIVRPFRSAAIYLAGSLSLLYIVLFITLSGPDPASREEMAEASRLMFRATAAIRDCRAAGGILLDPVVDPNGTGLIGLERSMITTSLGSLEAKRTSTNPNFAGLVVSLLHDAGARRGDAVAIGASGSFPAFMIAALSAAKVLGLEPLVISSLGSSEWGANIAGFDWTDMEDCLRAAGGLDARPIARSVGGDADVGRDMDPAGRVLLASRIRERDVPLLEEPDLVRNVEARMKLYFAAAGGRRVAAFVNVGGSWANIGTDAEVLKLRPGLASDVFVPPPARRGVIQAMAAAGIPVIHLLNVRGLCERYGLPWDPCPLPSPGDGLPSRGIAGKTPTGLALSVLYVLGMGMVLFFGRRRDWFPGG